MLTPFRHVFLVDDELICNYISLKWLKRLEVAENIFALRNGQHALDFLLDFEKRNDKNNPDLILLDIKMPVMDGIEFLAEFEKAPIPNKDKIRIVMLTSSTKESCIKEAGHYNISGYIEKPLNREKIEHLLANLFNSQSYTD